MFRMRWFGWTALLLCGACGSGEAEGEGTQALGSEPGAAPVTSDQEASPTPAPAIPPVAAGEFRVWIESELAEGASAPDGFRILRLPPRLEDSPTGAQVARREVLKGRWRDAPTHGEPIFVDLKPSDDVANFRWMVVAYAQNDLRQFPFAHEGYRLVELGTSPVFSIAVEGGEHKAVVQIEPALRAQPRFSSGAVQEALKFDFVYGPIADRPREIRGTWPGEGPLPFLLSRYARGREGYLTLVRDAWPHPESFGPIEFELNEGNTYIDFPAFAPAEPLEVLVQPADASTAWQNAEIVAGYLTDEALPGISLFGQSDSSGRAVQTGALSGRYHLTARDEQSGDILLGWAAHGSELDSVRIAQRPLPTTGRMHLQDLPEGDWDVTVYSFWGALQVARTPVTAESEGTLPHTGEMKHFAVAQRFHEQEEHTEIIIFLECEWAGDHWHFMAEPTVCEVAAYLQGDDLAMHLIVGQFPEPEQFFPAPHWQVEAGRAETVPYFPLRFKDGAVIRGLAEGDYEATVWGPAKTGGKAEELATFYPQAKREES